MIVVDLFAGIGYFSLVYAVHCNAKHVYCCEWNPHAVEALKQNAKLNHVEKKMTILFGDNRVVCPVNVAQHVNMGLIPSSLDSLSTACRALDPNSDTLYLHIHENVNYYSQINNSQQGPSKSIEEEYANTIKHKVKMEMSKQYPFVEWMVNVTDITCIKQYAPHIYHFVFDICCRHQ